MNVYRITLFEGATPAYAGTLAEAKPVATRDKHRRTLGDTRVDLIDVATDKAGVLALLNIPIGECLVWPGATLPALRTWKLSPRGALVETTKGE